MSDHAKTDQALAGLIYRHAALEQLVLNLTVAVSEAISDQPVEFREFLLDDIFVRLNSTKENAKTAGDRGFAEGTMGAVAELKKRLVNFSDGDDALN